MPSEMPSMRFLRKSCRFSVAAKACGGYARSERLRRLWPKPWVRLERGREAAPSMDPQAAAARRTRLGAMQGRRRGWRRSPLPFSANLLPRRLRVDRMRALRAAWIDTREGEPGSGHGLPWTCKRISDAARPQSTRAEADEPSRYPIRPAAAYAGCQSGAAR